MVKYNFLTDNYPIDRLTAVLDNSQVGALGVPGGFLGVLNIPDNILNEEDKIILCEFMRAEDIPSRGGLHIVMRGSDQNPIVFENDKDAKLTAQCQIPNLGKQLLYSVFKKTGVKFSIGVQSYNS